MRYVVAHFGRTVKRGVNTRRYAALSGEKTMFNARNLENIGRTLKLRRHS